MKGVIGKNSKWPHPFRDLLLMQIQLFKLIELANRGKNVKSFVMGA